MKNYLRLLRYLKPYLAQIIGASISIVLVTGTTLLIAPLAGFAFKAIGEKNLLLLNLSALGVIGLYLIKGFFTYTQDYLAYLVTFRAIIDLRTNLYQHLQNQSLDFFNKWHTGELISRTMNDIATLQNTMLITLTAIIPHSILLLGLIIYIFWINWRLSLLTLVALPLIIQVIRFFGKEIRSLSEHVQQKTADITSHIQETLSQIRVVKSFSMEEEEVKKLKNENIKSLNLTMRAVKILSTQNPVVALLQASAAVAIVWYGGIEIIRGNLTLPQLISFATALGIMTDPGSTLSKAFAVVQQGIASATRIFELLDIKPTIKEVEDAIELPMIKGEITFENVSFAYEKEEVLKDINLRIAPGEIIALVGRTGAGKSTLASLLLRFYDPTSGRILVDDYDLKKTKITSLRKQIAIVPQDISLFRGTIRENIAYGTPQASDQEIIEAAKQANAHPFISKLPDGYNTEVGERGVKLSGGERQRIAIARAILRNPRILILDEATSSLDPETEALIREALEKLMKNRTTLIIAHRLYTIEKANRIVVLDNGKIVETGTFQELLEKGGLFKYLYEISQNPDSLSENNPNQT